MKNVHINLIGKSQARTIRYKPAWYHLLRKYQVKSEYLEAMVELAKLSLAKPLFEWLDGQKVNSVLARINEEATSAADFFGLLWAVSEFVGGDNSTQQVTVGPLLHKRQILPADRLEGSLKHRAHLPLLMARTAQLSEDLTFKPSATVPLGPDSLEKAVLETVGEKARSWIVLSTLMPGDFLGNDEVYRACAELNFQFPAWFEAYMLCRFLGLDRPEVASQPDDTNIRSVRTMCDDADDFLRGAVRNQVYTVINGAFLLKFNGQKSAFYFGRAGRQHFAALYEPSFIHDPKLRQMIFKERVRACHVPAISWRFMRLPVALTVSDILAIACEMRFNTVS